MISSNIQTELEYFKDPFDLDCCNVQQNNMFPHWLEGKHTMSFSASFAVIKENAFWEYANMQLYSWLESKASEFELKNPAFSFSQ